MTINYPNDMVPSYTAGDRVLVTNPLDIFGTDDTTVYTVTHVKFSEKHGVFVYRLNGGQMWVNEAWLEPDMFGPQYIEDTTKHDRKALIMEQDYLLRSLSDSISTKNAEAIAYDTERLHEIADELRRINDDS